MGYPKGQFLVVSNKDLSWSDGQFLVAYNKDLTWSDGQFLVAYNKDLSVRRGQILVVLKIFPYKMGKTLVNISKFYFFRKNSESTNS